MWTGVGQLCVKVLDFVTVVCSTTPKQQAAHVFFLSRRFFDLT